MNSLSEHQIAVNTFHYPTAGSEDTPNSGLPWQSGEDHYSAVKFEEKLAKARHEGRSEGERQAREHIEQELREIRTEIRSAIYAFAQERTRHLRALESEAVKLSLTIARRILLRESQVDPALLLGLVRSSLQELSETSPVLLFVPKTSVDEWQNLFRETAQEQPEVEVRADSKLHGQECRIESSLGTTTLSLEASLSEIENGLFDLLAGSVQSVDKHRLQ